MKQITVGGIQPSAVFLFLLRARRSSAVFFPSRAAFGNFVVLQEITDSIQRHSSYLCRNR